MTIRDFRYLVAVAECLNFHQAAHRCHARQSTVSIQLRKLEDYLGIHCFDRGHGSVRITGEGRECVRQARILLAAFDAMRAIAAGRVDALAAVAVQGRQSALSRRRPEGEQ